MKCSKCGLRLARARDGYKTQLNSLEVERVEQWVCVNKNCDRYAGEDLSNPKVIEHRASEKVETIDF